jgi:hypothetical protein
MLFQMDILAAIVNYIPTFITITFDIIILIFAIFIFKRNSYRYGVFLMLFAILSLVQSIIYIAIGYPDLFYRLYYDMGLDFATVNMILMSIFFVFLTLNVASTIFLIVAIVQIYKTHQRATFEQNRS